MFAKLGLEFSFKFTFSAETAEEQANNQVSRSGLVNGYEKIRWSGSRARGHGVRAERATGLTEIGLSTD